MIGREKGLILVDKGDRAVGFSHGLSDPELNRGELLACGIGEDHISITDVVRKIIKKRLYPYI